MAQSDVTRKFAKRLKEVRNKAGLTQEAVAERAELSARHYQQLESPDNTSSPQLDTIARLAKVFKMSISKFLNF